VRDSKYRVPERRQTEYRGVLPGTTGATYLSGASMTKKKKSLIRLTPGLHSYCQTLLKSAVLTVFPRLLVHRAFLFLGAENKEKGIQFQMSSLCF
jgi:hypothetical protein